MTRADTQAIITAVIENARNALDPDLSSLNELSNPPVPSPFTWAELLEDPLEPELLELEPELLELEPELLELEPELLALEPES